LGDSSLCVLCASMVRFSERQPWPIPSPARSAGSCSSSTAAPSASATKSAPKTHEFSGVFAFLQPHLPPENPARGCSPVVVPSTPFHTNRAGRSHFMGLAEGGRGNAHTRAGRESRTRAGSFLQRPAGGPGCSPGPPTRPKDQPILDEGG